MNLDIVDNIEGWLSKNEALLLYTLAKSIPAEGEVVEIGSFKGKSTVALALGLAKTTRKGFVWAIDPHEGIIKKGNTDKYYNTLDFLQKNILDAKIENKIKILVMTSKKAQSNWNKPIRLLFLDGLHDYENTKMDYDLWSPFVVNNGVIAFHDAFCGEKGVEKVLMEKLFNSKKIKSIGVTTSIMYFVVGQPNFKERMVVRFKIKIIKFSQKINRFNMPWLIKLIFIHYLLRLMLLTNYTLKLYISKHYEK